MTVRRLAISYYALMVLILRESGLKKAVWLSPDHTYDISDAITIAATMAILLYALI